MEPFAEAVYEEICKRKLYRDYASSCKLFCPSAIPGFEITFKGMTASPVVNPDDLEQNNKDVNFIVREVTMLLNEIGLGNILYICGSGSQPKINDVIFNYTDMKPSDTRNGRLLDKLKISSDEIPEQFICQISRQLMDEPVYIKGHAEIKYNLPHLRYWIFQQNEMQNPFTRQMIQTSDIIYDDKLKKEINAYIQMTTMATMEPLKNKVEERLRDIFYRYKLQGNPVANLETAFRRAAALNKRDDLKFLLTQINDMNKADETQGKQKSALHWAAQNGHVECVKLLVQAGARCDIPDAHKRMPLHLAVIHEQVDCAEILIKSGARGNIPDALGKTAPDYAKEKSNQAILELFNVPNSQACSSIPRLQFQ